MAERPAVPEEVELAKSWRAWRAVGWWRVVNGPDVSRAAAR